VEAAVAVEGIGEVGSVARVLELVEFELLAGGEGKFFERVARGIEPDACEFAGLEAIGAGDFLEESGELLSLELLEGLAFEEFFGGVVVPGGVHRLWRGRV
jgi:hypothetical protein